MYAITCMLNDSAQQDQELMLFRSYVGQCLWALETIKRREHDDKTEVTQYIDLAFPKAKEKQMTAEEIKAHVLERLRG